ncbi:type I 3-dehydroquinate dehydratase [Treponema primitia]|uniref:type I 3-dehydroquinate dehydratase n=1 Tax=Treponema primitia TaxID=88058 RepID=UPI0002554E97|nr:type I 3-dehydroquinate dehydratase [Treponema primitia]
MAKICLCLTGKTFAKNLEVLEKYRKYVDIAELRVDFLDPDERFLIRRFPELAGLPVILTIRRLMDGGNFVGGEGSRIALFSKGLAFAEADRRRNFAYVDLEDDLNVPSLEEAARTFGTRIIRSYHNMQGIGEDPAARLRNMLHVGDEIAKAAVMPQSFEDVRRVYQAARETAGMEKILLCMGHLGISTRILAEYMGCYLSYTTAMGEKDFPPGAPGQLSPRDLVELYRFRNVTPKTKLFGILGYPLNVTSSPEFFNTVFSSEKIDAVYVPFPSDSVEAFMQLAGEINLAGASVTIPYKEKVLPYLGHKTAEVESLGACNTLICGPQGWSGANTDTHGFSDSLLAFTGKKDFKRMRITIIGSGGAARAAAAEVFRLKGKALVLNRTLVHARELAALYRFAWGGLDGRGAELMSGYNDIIIQTTSVGMDPDLEGDPLELYFFNGTEVVMDLIYKPERTRFLTRAAAAGCKVLNGHDMLIRQAKYQYSCFFGKEYPSKLVSREWIK